MRQWRLIYDQPTDGQSNMAIDDAILHAVSAKLQPPTLRLYGWEPFYMSLGYGQSLRDVDQERLHERGWGVVRRPTGGRAILHGDELTYSLALPMDHELAHGDIVTSYRRISEALLAALQVFGISPRSDRNDDQPSTKGPVCFEVPSHYEITIEGRKLIGSAQVRRKDGILQHGSLPLWGDVGRICDALAYPDELTRQTAKQKVQQRATTLSEWVADVTYEQAADALQHGFATCFDIEFIHTERSESENQQAERLKQTVYDNDVWTHKR